MGSLGTSSFDKVEFISKNWYALVFVIKLLPLHIFIYLLKPYLLKLNIKEKKKSFSSSSNFAQSY